MQKLVDTLKVTNTLSDYGLMAAVCLASGVAVQPSSAQLTARLNALVAQRQDQEFPPPHVKDAVRNLLKRGGFKPSGRNKPASEYLAQAAREGRFPTINNLVDVNNLISLQTGLPISLLDAGVLGDEIVLRCGREGERYVFNSVGQEIDLAGLICACAGRSDTPLGNPIKDSIAGKIKPETTSVVGIIYAPSSGELAEIARTEIAAFAELLTQEGQAHSMYTVVA